MAFQITINGIDRTLDLVDKSLKIDDIVNDQVNTCSFKLYDRFSNGYPTTDQEIIITNNDGSRAFGGYVLNTQLQQFEDGIVTCYVNGTDYTRLLDRFLVKKTYLSQTDQAIILDMVANYASGQGIDVSNVGTGSTISQLTFNYTQLSQAIQKVAKETGYSWYIDYFKKLYYFATNSFVAPYNINNVGVTTSYANDPITGAPVGTLQGSAFYDATNHYIRLTQALNSQAGAIYYNATLPSNFEFDASIYAGSAEGADANYIFWGCASVPADEDNNTSGYVVAFDEYQGQVQLKFAGNNLVTPTSIAFADGAFHAAQVIVTGNNIVVKVDGVTVINFTDYVRTLGGNYFGVGARTGEVNTEHRVKLIAVYNTILGSTNFKQLTIKSDSSQLKNRVYVRGGTKQSSNTTYSVKGDGVAKAFPLPEKPHGVTVTVNGVTKTLGIKNVNTTGYDWYVNFEEKYIEQDAGGTTLTTADTLAVTYAYDIPILVAQEDTASIAAHGVHEFAIFDKTITTTDAARTRALAELADFAANQVDVTFITMQTGFQSGQYMTINRADYNSNAEYFVYRVTAQAIGGGVFEYKIELQNAKTIGMIKFLQNLLQSQKDLIELSSNEVVDELFTISDTITTPTDAVTSLVSTTPPFTWRADDGTGGNMQWDSFQWA